MRFAVAVPAFVILVAICPSRSSAVRSTPQDAGTRYCADTGFSLPQSCVGAPLLLSAPDNLYTTFAVLAEPQASVVCHWSCRSTLDPAPAAELKTFHGPWRLDDSDMTFDGQNRFLLFGIATSPHAPVKLLRVAFDLDFRVTNAELANISSKTVTQYRLGWIYDRGSTTTVGQTRTIALPPATSRPTGSYNVPTNLYGSDKGTVIFYVAYVQFENGDQWQVTLDDIKRMMLQDKTKSKTKKKQRPLWRKDAKLSPRF